LGALSPSLLFFSFSCQNQPLKRIPGSVPAAAVVVEEKMPNKSLKKLTPVLFVEKIEPCLPFWVERLGFQKTAEVPEGEALGFVILARDGVEVMLQTRASVAKDVPALAQEPSRSFLYVEVADFADIKRRLAGADIVIPERKTFYGATEIGVRDPAGNVITFAQFAGRG
jgi:uncharacterized glyoxalase superfamily protein PhnB